MKLCTFEVRAGGDKHQRLGAVIQANGAEWVVDVHSAAKSQSSDAARLVPPSMRGLLEGGAAAMEAVRKVLAAVSADTGKTRGDGAIFYRREDVCLLTPLPDARSLRDFYAFEAHVKKGFEKRGEPMPREWYEIPVYYQTGHHNLIGTDQDVLWPRFTERFDYELELAVIIGKQGSNIPASEAREYIAGFTILNDFSARDIQKREMRVRLGPAKGKHWCAGLGPWMVTPDEVGDPYTLEMTARVNGEEWSRGNSRDMFWKFEQMIEFLSQDDTIYPGDILGSGTVGTGCGLELDRWVKPGDVMELEIEKIGVLRNRVVRPNHPND